MKASLRAATVLSGALLLALPLAAQQGGGGGDVPPPPGRPGGYTGPGDTTPGGGAGPDQPGATPRRPLKPPGSGAAPSTPGSPYAGGVDPLAPRIPPPGIDSPGSPMNTPPKPTPTSPPTVENPNSWQLWWYYNRWAHLDVGATLSSTGSGGFYLGRGEKTQESPLLRASKAQKHDVVQPALIQALLSGGSADFQIYTLHALAKLRDVAPDDRFGGFDELVVPFLRSGNQTVAEKAVLALGIRGDDRYVPWLTGILADDQAGRELLGRSNVGHRIRAFAAYALGLIAERTQDPGVRLAIYEKVSEALWIERVEVQAACLTAIGLAPMPMDDEFLDGGESYAGKTRVDQVLDLIKFFEDPDQSFIARSQAPRALAQLVEDAPDSLRGRAAYSLLVACGQYTKEPREVQNAAVIALGRIGRSGPEPIDAEIRTQLERISDGSGQDRSTRYFALIALAEASSRRGRGDEPFAGIEPTRKELLRDIGRSRGETQAWTALALGILEEDAATRGQIAAPESGHALRQIFQRTRSAEVAGAIAIAMGMLRDVESEELLQERMVTAGEEYVRGYTALALGMMEARGTLRDVSNVLTASTYQPFVVENASIALSLLGDQETGSKLYTILEESSTPDVQASVASAVGWIKDPRPVSQLCELLIDTRKNDTARAWTAVAIGRICDADKWPWVARLSVSSNYDVWLPTLTEPAFHTGLLDLP